MQVMRGNVFIPIAKPNTGQTAVSQPSAAAPAQSFENILSKKLNESEALQFSKHAEMRLKSRDISLSEEQMQRAAEGVSKAKMKGIRDSLVLVDDVALVVNTKSNVVITAIDNKLDNVYTNIDGAVIV